MPSLVRRGETTLIKVTFGGGLDGHEKPTLRWCSLIAARLSWQPVVGAASDKTWRQKYELVRLLLAYCLMRQTNTHDTCYPKMISKFYNMLQIIGSQFVKTLEIVIYTDIRWTFIFCSDRNEFMIKLFNFQLSCSLHKSILKGIN